LDIPAFLESKDYVDRLILALDHPEKGTPLRAAWILGQLRQPKAVEALMASVQKTDDVYLIRAAIKALGEIGAPRAIAFLKSLCNHPARIVSEEATRILENKGILLQTRYAQENDRPNT
jgi:HEAT repeat protein